MKKIMYSLFFFILFFTFFNEKTYSEIMELKTSAKLITTIASIKTTKANLRSGPGKKYPILWDYIKRKWPIKGHFLYVMEEVESNDK